MEPPHPSAESQPLTDGHLGKGAWQGMAVETWDQRDPFTVNQTADTAQ